MSSNAIAFVAGLGSGYLGAQEKQKDRARQEKLDKVAFDRADRETEQYDKAKRKEQVMADAYRPTEVNQNAAMLGISGKPILYEDAGVANSDFRQARTIAASTGYPFAEPAPVHTFSAGGNSFDTQQGAQAGADAYNAPDARNKRVIAAMSDIDPLKALDLENQQAVRGREGVRFSQDQEVYAKRLKDEGALDALKALGSGDGAGMVAAFNKGGDFKVEGEPVIKTESRTIPGVGTIPTYTATFNIKSKDGTVKPMTVNSHDARMSLMDYEKALNMGLKGAQESREGGRAAAVFEETKRHNLVTERNAEITANAAATKATAAVGAAGGKPLNDAQSKALLFGSRMRESDEILNKLATAGTTTSIPGARGPLSGVINVLAPENKQMLDQAKRDFTNAVLRRESGAVIADSEFANADTQYFPQIGDTPKTIDQKAKNRKLALDGILLEVPESHRNSLQPRSAPNAPVAMPKDKTALQSGQTYQTSRGLARWNGKAFEAQ